MGFFDLICRDSPRFIVHVGDRHDSNGDYVVLASQEALVNDPCVLARVIAAGKIDTAVRRNDDHWCSVVHHPCWLARINKLIGVPQGLNDIILQGGSHREVGRIVGH